jgi:hypothetical protein
MGLLVVFCVDLLANISFDGSYPHHEPGSELASRWDERTGRTYLSRDFAVGWRNMRTQTRLNSGKVSSNV